MKILPFALLAAALVCVGLSPQNASPGTTSQQNEGRSATVIFLRHAEAKPRTKGNQNPNLADAGNTRAKLIENTLSQAGVKRIFATELVRTQQTAAPLAKSLGIKIESYQANRSRQFADTLRKLKDGEVVVVVGHSNTLPVMVAELGGSLAGLDKRGYLPDTQHERMIVQFLSSKSTAQPMRALQTLDLRIDN
jgi:phosphohistidine phosphatase SixA